MISIPYSSWFHIQKNLTIIPYLPCNLKEPQIPNIVKLVPILCLTFLSLLAQVNLYAQNVLLELESNSGGMLIPRTDTSSVVTPIRGLMILDTATTTVYIFNGMNWEGIQTTNSFIFSWADRDGDGYGDKYAAIYAPEVPHGYVINNLDCDDNAAMINPAATEVCDGLDNDCNTQIDDNVPACALPPNTDQVGCEDSCVIVSCADGFFDTNGVFSDGCECQAIGEINGNFCANSIDLGSITEGGIQTTTGNIPESIDEDWFRVRPTDASPSSASENFHFEVQFVSNPGNVHKIEVYDQCNGTRLNPFDDFYYELDGMPFSSDTKDFFIRVYLDSEALPTCEGYEISFSNGL